MRDSEGGQQDAGSLSFWRAQMQFLKKCCAVVALMFVVLWDAVRGNLKREAEPLDSEEADTGVPWIH